MTEFNEAQDEKERKAMLYGVYITLFVPIFLAAVVILDGFAGAILWGWFMVPIWNWPSITVPEAIGLKLMLGGMRGVQFGPKDSKLQDLFWLFGSPIIAVAIGWCAKQFI